MISDGERAAFEARLFGAFGAAFSGRTDELVRLLGMPPDTANVPASFWGELSDSLRAPLGEMLEEVVLVSAQNLAALKGGGLEIRWTAINQRAAAWASTYAYSLITGVSAVTMSRLQEIIAGFFANPKQDIRSLAESISSMFGDSRSMRIAVTEVTRAAAYGEVLLANEIVNSNPGRRVIQIWMTSRDEFVCPICGPRHGQPTRGELPPAHPMCRCGVATDFV